MFSIKNIIINHFPNRTVVISTSKDTKFINLHTSHQIFILITLFAAFSFLGSRYIKYVNKYNLLQLIARNQELENVNNKLNESIISINENMESFYNYFNNDDIKTLNKSNLKNSHDNDVNNNDKNNDLVINKLSFYNKKISSYQDLQNINIVYDNNINVLHASIGKSLIKMTNTLNTLGMKSVSMSNYILTDNSNYGTNKSNNNLAVGGPYEEYENDDNFIPIRRIPDTINKNNIDLVLKNMIKIQNLMNILPIGVSPIKGSYKISSKYGKRIDPVLRNKHAMHGGLDLVGEHKKNQIISVLDGVIVFSGKKHGYGYSIDILHKSGNESIITRYGHLSKINVEKGDIVKKNQVIGLQGSTGRATGEHLHYEIRYLNKTLNPIHFINFNDKNKV